LPSSLFWNQPPDRDPTRSVDPLGFDALREAMADKLVPLLTGATRDADEYLWTLIGLRWAREATGSSIDATLFSKGFAPFERALKQYWYKFRGRTSGGINVVKKVCEEAQPDVARPILVDQRATGLLGNYIVSLRGMRLVQKDSLRVIDAAADRLLLDIRFAPPRSWTSCWSVLNQAFDGIELKAARQRLGGRLFGGESQEMSRAARAALARPKAAVWARTGRLELDSEQARLADATTAVVRLEAAALDAFGELLRGEKVLPASTRRSLRSLAAAARDADPFPLSWPAGSPLRSAIHEALSSLARGRNPAVTLLRLHVAVTREVRQTEPWLLYLGEIPAGFQRWRPGTGVPDFRFGNLRTLVRQTRWRPHAS
jgi:hypothetical protein